MPHAFDHVTMISTRPNLALQSQVSHTPLRIDLPQEGQRITLSSLGSSINTRHFSQSRRTSPDSIKLFFSSWPVRVIHCPLRFAEAEPPAGRQRGFGAKGMHILSARIHTALFRYTFVYE